MTRAWTNLTSAELFQPSQIAVDRFQWAPPRSVSTPTGSIAGGALLGVATNVLKTMTGRAPLWCTAQFVSLPAWSETVNIYADVLARGRSVSQARCTLIVDDQLVALVLGAAANLSAPSGAAVVRPPRVPAAEHCVVCPFLDLVGDGATKDMSSVVELRLARGSGTVRTGRTSRPGRGRVALWVRVGQAGSRRFDSATLAFVGDLALIVLSDALGTLAGGASLDNSVRFGPLSSGEWLLLDAKLIQFAEGVGHIRGDIWSDDGALLASVTQSCIVRIPSL